MDADLTAVVFDFADQGSAVVTWAMCGELEGLAVLGEADTYCGVSDQTFDASDRDAWRVHRGETITSVGAAWHVSGAGCPESLWALRLDFATGSTVIALGGADPELDYMPDELVVVFAEELASAYRPRHVTAGAWGDRIDPA